MRIDPRAGSGPLIPLMSSRGVRGVEEALLSFGDIAILGNGPEGLPVQVGIEYKKLPDLIACIGDGRLVGHQLPGMLSNYDVVWLLVEGIWREDRSSGLIEVPYESGWRPLPTGRGITATALEGFLMSLIHQLGVRVMRTGTSGQTVDWLYQLNRWWTGKEWEQHRTHLQFDNSQAISLLQPPTVKQRIAAQLPGIGVDRSRAVARHFPSVVDMVVAGEKEWANIPGVGKITAAKVVRALEAVDGLAT